MFKALERVLRNWLRLYIGLPCIASLENHWKKCLETCLCVDYTMKLYNVDCLKKMHYNLHVYTKELEIAKGMEAE